jgi:8-oxo-dGTP diphosphatase
MPHINNQPGQHDHTVSAYIIRVDTPEPQALVHMHRKLNRLLAVGGHIELNETPWQAMAHELQEESGYVLDELQILQPPHVIKNLDKVSLHPYPLAMNTHNITPEHFHSDIEYGFIAQSAPTGHVNDGESTDLRWYTRAQIANLDESEIYTNTKQIYEFMFDTALTSWEQVSTSEFAL